MLLPRRLAAVRRQSTSQHGHEAARSRGSTVTRQHGHEHGHEHAREHPDPCPACPPEFGLTPRPTKAYQGLPRTFAAAGLCYGSPTVSSVPGRNERCPCGSGRKYKQCCANKVVEQPASRSFFRVAVGMAALALIFASVAVGRTLLEGSEEQPARVWSEEHGHWHDGAGNNPEDPPPGKVWSEEHGHWHDAPPLERRAVTPGAREEGLGHLFDETSKAVDDPS